jgi:hypothetical protein
MPATWKAHAQRLAAARATAPAAAPPKRPRRAAADREMAAEVRLLRAEVREMRGRLEVALASLAQERGAEERANADPMSSTSCATGW